MELPNSVYRHLIQTGYSKRDILFLLRQHNLFVVTSLFIEGCGYTVRVDYTSPEFSDISKVLLSKMIKIQEHSLGVIESYFYSEKLQSSRVINGDLSISFSSRPAYEVTKCLFSVVSRSVDNAILFSGAMTLLSHLLVYLRKSNLSTDIQLTLITHSSVLDSYMMIDDGDVIRAYCFNSVTGNMTVASTSEALNRAHSWNIRIYPLQMPNFMILQLLSLITSGALTYDAKRDLWECLIGGIIKRDMISALIQHYSRQLPVISCINSYQLSLWNEFPSYSETLRVLDIRESGRVVEEDFTVNLVTLSLPDVRKLYRGYLQARGIHVGLNDIILSSKDIGLKVIKYEQEMDRQCDDDQRYDEQPGCSY